MHVSFILPFYGDKAKWFRYFLPVNDGFRADGVEVVLVLDEPAEEAQVMDIVRSNTDIKFRVIVNDWDHPWRPPCMAYNVGIRNSLSDHVILADPESAFTFPSPDYPQRLIREDFRACYAGVSWMGDDFKVGDDTPWVIKHKLIVLEAIHKVWHCGNGFLLAPKIALERICGYDESRTTYGYDDNDIRVRLARGGQRIIIDGQIKVFHAWHNVHRICPDEFPGPNIALTEQKETWGRAYSRTAFDWNKK